MSTIHLFHVTAPTCWWSWGYEAVMNRVQAVYGDQVSVHVAIGCVYDDLADYKAAYELDSPAKMEEWQREGASMMGVPLGRFALDRMPPTVRPATDAAIAATKQDPDAARRLLRAFLYRSVLEDADVTTEQGIRAAAKGTGLDVDQLIRDMADTDYIEKEDSEQRTGFPHLGYYNLALTDGENRTILLDYAFDPKVVEDAIDWLGKGKLKKHQPKDVHAYIEENAWASLVEVRRVFDLDERTALSTLEKLEKEGKAERRVLAAAPHWRAIA